MQHPRLTAALTVLVFASAPCVARADEMTATKGNVTATLSWDNHELPDPDTGIRLRVQRGGAVVSDGVQVAADDAFLSILPGIQPPALAVRDLDAKGTPEVVVTTFSGGAYCCWDTRVYAGPDYKTEPTTFQFGESGWRLRDLGRGPAADLTLGAPTYHYVPVSHGGSGYPLVVLNYVNGRFVDVSRRFPKRLRRDARGWRKDWLGFKRGNAEARGALSAYVVDLKRLGRDFKAEQEIGRAGQRNQLPEGTREFRKEIAKLMRALRAGRSSPFAHQQVP